MYAVGTSLERFGEQTPIELCGWIVVGVKDVCPPPPPLLVIISVMFVTFIISSIGTIRFQRVISSSAPCAGEKLCSQAGSAHKSHP